MGGHGRAGHRHPGCSRGTAAGMTQPASLEMEFCVEHSPELGKEQQLG